MYSFLLILFSLCVLAILHSYVFYPLGLFLFSKQKKNRAIVFSKQEELPPVCIIMAAYNEEKVLDAKIKSIIESDYPKDKISVLIGSDASIDNTNAIVKNWEKDYPFIQLIEFKARTGKVGIVNELVTRSNQDILILTDANVMLKPDTIFNLVRFFKDENVAQVCANIVKTGAGEGISSQEITYMALENKIKLLESINWKIVMGAEGGCNAIRRKNYAAVPSNFCVDDFYVSMNVIEQGKEIVFDEEAICYEDASSLSSIEFARKVRISMGNFQNLSRYKKLLLPPWKGSAFAFLSHKVLRWITPFLLLASLFTSFALGFFHSFFFIVFAVQLIGILTPVFTINSRLYKVISHFYLMNMALLKGFFIFMRGIESSIWQPTKRNV